MKNLIYLLLSVFILGSCSNKFSLQKRKYTKGYYFANNHKVKAKENTVVSSKQTKSSTLQNNEVVETVVVKATEQNNALHNTAPVVAKKEIKKVLSQPLAFKSNVESFKTIGKTYKTQIGQSQQESTIQKGAIIKKIIKILFGIIAGMLITIGAIFYILGLADSTFYLLAYVCFGAALFFIILTLLIKAT